MRQSDTIVIGAGMAGLAAARELTRAGRRVLMLEARDRIGGRIDTVCREGWPIPMERGAEFVHGTPEGLWRLLDEANVVVSEVVDEHAESDESGKLRNTGAMMQAVERTMGRLEQLPKHAPDVSWAEFLRMYASDLSHRDHVLSTAYIEGFDATDRDEISARELQKANIASKKVDIDTPFRPIGGYASLAAFLLHKAEQTGLLDLQLGRIVQTVRWHQGDVTVEHTGLNGTLDQSRAAHLIVTVPVGVLRAAPDQPGAVRFEPELPQSHVEALGHLRMGLATRVMLRFDERFWECDQPELAFFHDPHQPFPTGWTQRPLKLPIITMWAGGRQAEAMRGLDEDTLVGRAIASLSAMLQQDAGDLRRRLQDAIVGDWSGDPFARGVYAYVTVGGSGCRETLAKPIDDTLYFAGEATDVALSGTTAGALESGARAANLILGAARV
ncbi:MAG: NAD(P)/FAD-dependent oxidoreductase [Tepidisphaeraceae bacterium]